MQGSWGSSRSWGAAVVTALDFLRMRRWGRKAAGPRRAADRPLQARRDPAMRVDARMPALRPERVEQEAGRPVSVGPSRGPGERYPAPAVRRMAEARGRGRPESTRGLTRRRRVRAVPPEIREPTPRAGARTTRTARSIVTVKRRPASASSASTTDTVPTVRRATRRRTCASSNVAATLIAARNIRFVTRRRTSASAASRTPTVRRPVLGYATRRLGRAFRA
jgi:hypothetical protein